MKRTKFALAALLLTIAAVARSSLRPQARQSSSARVQGGLDLRRPAQRRAAGRRRTTRAGSHVQKALGSKVQTTYKENIARGPQLQQTVASLVQQGYKMIFGTSYGFFDKKLAAKYPDVIFEQATGTDTAKNLSEYFGAGEDTIYLSGMAAGAASKSGQARLVVAVPDPEVIRHSNAFTLGAQVDASGRDGQARLDAAGSTRPRRRRPPRASSPPAPTCSARTSTRPRPASSPSRRASRGSATTPTRRSSRRSRGSPQRVYNWGGTTSSASRKRWPARGSPASTTASLKDGFTRLAPFGPDVSAATKAKIAAKMKAMENGSFNVFAGPLYDQSGKLRVPKGQTMQTLKGGTNSLYGMNWLVKGVIGSPTGK